MKKQITIAACLAVLLVITVKGPVLLATIPQVGAITTTPVPPVHLHSTAVHEGSGLFFGFDQEISPGPSVFLPDIQVNNDPGNVVDDYGPAIAVSSTGIIYIVWNGDETTKQVMVARSTDGGISFSPAVPVNDSVAYPPSFSVFQPDIALDADDNVYVVWHDYRAWTDDNAYTSPIDVYMDKSTDGGLTWGTDVIVSAGGTGTYPWHFQPYIAIDESNNNIYVSFTDYDRYYPTGDPGDVSLARSIDGGISFQPKIRVDDTADSLLVFQEFSSVAVDQSSGEVYVAFEDGRGSSVDIFVARSTDGGVSFATNTRVNVDTTRIQEQPTVVVDPAGHIYVTWMDWRNDPDPASAPFQNHIYLGKSTDAGLTFSAGVQVTDVYMNGDFGFDFPPRVAADDNGWVHVVWFDRRVNTTLCYYDVSSDGGQTFGTDLILHNNVDSLTHALPRIAIDTRGNPMATWMDRRNGNGLFDVFFTGPDRSDAAIGPATTLYRLGQNYPNPFNPATVINYVVPAGGGVVTLGVYDVSGRRVRTLVDGPKSEGQQFVLWDGRTETGNRAVSGVYFYRMTATGFTQTRKMVLLQ